MCVCVSLSVCVYIFDVDDDDDDDDDDLEWLSYLEEDTSIIQLTFMVINGDLMMVHND